MLTYRYKDTVIHKLNPLCKLVWVGSITLLCLIFENLFYLLMFFFLVLLVIFFAKIIREWIPFMKFAFFLCLAIIMINVLFANDGEHILWSFSYNNLLTFHFTITLEAILFSVCMSIRLLTVISAFVILTLTIHPDDLMLIMIKFKIPFKSVLLTSLSIRFVPTLIRDVETITEVQRARGLELDRGSRLSRISKRIPILIALLSTSLERAIQLAEAMESRAFGSSRRTVYREISLSKIDYVFLTIGFSAFTFGLLLRLIGYGGFQYYASVELLVKTYSELGAIFSLFLVIFTMTLLSLLKKMVDID